MKLSKDKSRHWTDERINTVTHLAGSVFALTGAAILILLAVMEQTPWHIVGMSIYGFSLVFLFVVSTLHHSINASKAVEHALRVVDYCSVFLLIAGTMTPVCLIVIRGPFGWAILGTTWVAAIVAIALKASIGLDKWLTTAFSLILGWMGAVVALVAWSALPLAAFVFLAAGGIAYSIGAIIFYYEWPNLFPGHFGFHEIWHLFVLLAAALHWFFMYRYVLPF